MAEGLFHDHPRPSLLGLREPRIPQELHDRRVGLRRRREVEDAVALRAAFRLDLVEGRLQLLVERRVLEIAGDVLHRRGEVSRPPLGRRREFLGALLQVGAEVAVAVRAAGEPDDREVRRDRAVAREMRDRGSQQPPGQVSRGSEDDEGARRTDLLLRLAGRDRLGGPGGRLEDLGSRLPHSGLTAWPPNWLRSAAMTLAEKDSVLPRGEAREERVGEGRNRHGALDRLVKGPAPFARVLDVAADAGELRVRLEGEDEQIEQPRADDRGVGPEAGDLAEVEVVTGGLEHLEALAVALEHRVLDRVVDHLDVVPRAGGAHARVSVRRREGLQRGLDEREVPLARRRPSGSSRSSGPRRLPRSRSRESRSPSRKAPPRGAPSRRSGSCRRPRRCRPWREARRASRSIRRRACPPGSSARPPAGGGSFPTNSSSELAPRPRRAPRPAGLSPRPERTRRPRGRPRGGAGPCWRPSFPDRRIRASCSLPRKSTVDSRQSTANPGARRLHESAPATAASRSRSPAATSFVRWTRRARRPRERSAARSPAAWAATTSSNP